VCQHLISRPSDALLQFLYAVNEKALSLKDSGRDVVEVVPPPECVKSKLRDMIALGNVEIVRREMAALDCLEKGEKAFSEEEMCERVSKILGEK